VPWGRTIFWVRRLAFFSNVGKPDIYRTVEITTVHGRTTAEMFVKVMCGENRKVLTSASSTTVQNEATA
jgi:hypothetical protein